MGWNSEVSFGGVHSEKNWQLNCSLLTQIWKKIIFGFSKDWGGCFCFNGVKWRNSIFGISDVSLAFWSILCYSWFYEMNSSRLHLDFWIWNQEVQCRILLFCVSVFRIFIQVSQVKFIRIRLSRLPQWLNKEYF